MRTIEYKVTYTGYNAKEDVHAGPTTEYVKVTARDINSGFTKALKRANEPLGNGTRREIGSIEFWQVM